MNILLTIAYNGENYVGWQRQINGVSVQEKVENALCKIYNCHIFINGASRTDSGVSALGQRATFIAPENIFPLERLPQIVNAKLPLDIAILDAIVVPDEFHARYNAVEKTYEYYIYNRKIRDTLNHRQWHIWFELDFEKMERCVQNFVGTHDFSAFCAKGGNTKTNVRTIHSATISKENDVIKISITGDGFLYNMVRIIVGTLVFVGCGKIDGAEIPNIIASGERKKAGKTAPPHGLLLKEIKYGSSD